MSLAGNKVGWLSYPLKHDCFQEEVRQTLPDTACLRWKWCRFNEDEALHLATAAIAEGHLPPLPTLETTDAVMPKTHTHFFISENRFFDFIKFFHFCIYTPQKSMRRNFGMISVVVFTSPKKAIWFHQMVSYDVFDGGIRAWFSVAWLSRKNSL